jgi:UDP-N-acetylmuramoyl-L-alanyl-D-glutamate--2,6-diaminopimelate ligase
VQGDWNHSSDEALALVGVTGTHGKTCVAHLLHHILRCDGRVTAAWHGAGCCDGETTLGASVERARPELITRWLRTATLNECGPAIMELSLDAHAQGVTSVFKPEILCVTNLHTTPLSSFSSAAAYRKQAERLAAELTTEGLLIVNSDEPGSASLASRAMGAVLSYSLEHEADVNVQVVERHANEQIFTLTIGAESQAVRVPVSGDFYAANCAAAATTALAFGVDALTIAHGLETAPPLARVLRPIGCGQEFPVLIDAARSPESLRQALGACRHFTTERLLAVVDVRPLRQRGRSVATMLAVAEAAADRLIVIDDRADEHAGTSQTTFVDDRLAAIAIALALAEADDTVLIAGSPNQAAVSGESDEQIVRTLLRRRHEQELQVMPRRKAA